VLTEYAEVLHLVLPAGREPEVEKENIMAKAKDSKQAEVEAEIIGLDVEQKPKRRRRRGTKVEDIDLDALRNDLVEKVDALVEAFLDGEATLEQWDAANVAYRALRRDIKRIDRTRGESAIIPQRRRGRAAEPAPDMEREVSSLEEMTVPELKRILEEAGEATTGKKADLIERIKRMESSDGGDVFEIVEDDEDYED